MPRFYQGLSISPQLQAHFVDKVTGLPLSNGKIWCYKDNNRTNTGLKPLYTQTGDAGPYSFVALDNPLILSAAGNIVNGSDSNIVPYIFPFQGTPDNSTGQQELYYIRIEDENGEFQGELPGFPYSSSADVVSGSFKNYIPNGQFLVHYDLPKTDIYAAGEVRGETTYLGDGGLYYIRPSTSTAKDFITFTQYDVDFSGFTGTPRFSAKFKCTDTGNEQGSKDFCIRFNDVNKFASNTQEYTFSASGYSSSGGPISLQVYVRKFYGSNGGSTSDENLKGTISFTSPPAQIQSIAFTFGLNTGKTIGSAGDDYVEICVRFPADATFEVDLTNNLLTDDDVEITQYPQTTNADVISRAVAGWADNPNPDGSNLHLPMILTKEGMIWDDSLIGEPYLSLTGTDFDPTSIDNKENIVSYNGKYRLETAGYSPLGIPYSRLYNKRFKNETLNIPKAGTGPGYFVSCYGSAFGLTSNLMRLVNNTSGTVSVPTAGTGTIFSSSVVTISLGSGSHGVKSYLISSDTLYLQNINNGDANGAANGSGLGSFIFTPIQKGSSVLNTVTGIKVLSASAITPGSYFTFEDFGSTANEFYLWYSINNVGTDPLVSGTGIKVNLTTGDTASLVAQKTRETLNAWASFNISFNAASSINPGDYWNAQSTDGTTVENYKIWYSKNGSGTAPSAGGSTLINVNLTGAEDGPGVTLATQKAINSKYYGVPDFRGLFARGSDGGSNIDAGNRFSMVPGYIGNDLITYELSENIQHNHSYSNQATPINIQDGAAAIESLARSDVVSQTTGNQGGSESRPINFNAQWVAKY